MSHTSTKPVSPRGFSHAIFSSSPINFNKENRPPAGRNNHASCSDLRTELPVESCNRNLSENIISTGDKIGARYKSSRPINITTYSTTNLTRSKSVTMLQKQDSSLSLKSSSEEKLKISTRMGSNSRLSSDKTLVTHFCTPKRIAGSKLNVSTPSKTPRKRYFTDHTVSHATPECFNKIQVETPRSKQEVGIDEQTMCEGETSNLTVGVRVRPLNFKELNESKVTSIVVINGQNITVDCEAAQHTFVYDHCFVSHIDPFTPGHANQETVFRNMVLPLVDNAFEGYNACLFAYGQTGSGKSYSMMGVETGTSTLGPETGIIPRFCHEIFSRASKNPHVTITVEISYFEIYNEKIHDLLASNVGGSKRAPLKVREHPVFGPYVVDLSQHGVESYEDLQAWLKVGHSQRATAATGMNEKSSRSHSIFSVILTQTQLSKLSDSKSVKPSRSSKINLVDLAGSERLSQTCASGDRLREGVSINKSLLTLGKVIGCLAESTGNQKRGFVPYRESELTWLLKESLGGNSKTAMLATVSPANIHLEETLATLRYACQARAIVNRVRINEDPQDRQIRELKVEIVRLRGMLEGHERRSGVQPRRLLDNTEGTTETAEEIRSKEREIENLRKQLKKTEEQLSVTQKSWLEKLQEAEEKKNTELRYLRRCGIAVKIDFREKRTEPCLVNLAADPILSGTLLYLIPPGSVCIGRRNDVGGTPFKQPDIVLDGPLVRRLHCTIVNDNGKLVLTPEMDGDTYVNGQIVTSRVLLRHGDRLVIGGNHYFRVCNPHDDQNSTEISKQPVTFEFAHQEILKIQEERLRAELEESKQKAIKELESAKREVEVQLGSQKSTYEREIELLGSTLEQQKLALEEVNRKKKELELEKELLTSEVESNNRLRKVQFEESRLNVSPYRSNFLQELEDVLSETTADAEIALKMKISDDAMKTGGVSLHEMQLLVREATERCREVGINYEFDQQQVVAEKGLQPVIRVRDKDRTLETLWQPMRFLDWIHRLRDFDIEDSVKELRDSEDDWELYENSQCVEDSLNNSRISINMTPVKKQLNESLQQLSMDASFVESNLADQTSESVVLKRHDDIVECLLQMELATKTLGKLCHLYESREISGEVTKSLDKVHSIINGLKNTLERKKVNETDVDNAACVSNASELDNTVIDKSETINLTADTDVECNKKYLPDWSASPTKSNLRSGCSFLKNVNTPKSVRFDVK